MNKKEFKFDFGDTVRLVDVSGEWSAAERTGKAFIIKHRQHSIVDNVYTIQSADGDYSAFFERNLVLVSKARK